jgi:predicted TIM-barrel fold metal-dependent hydrolase
VGVVDVLGADHVLFGSDFPHPEGIGDPITFVDKLEGLPDADVRQIMGGNMHRLMGTPVPA